MKDHNKKTTKAKMLVNERHEGFSFVGLYTEALLLHQ